MKTALLIIELQRGFFESNPAPWDAEAVIGRINRLAARAQPRGPDLHPAARGGGSGPGPRLAGLGARPQAAGHAPRHKGALDDDGLVPRDPAARSPRTEGNRRGRRLRLRLRVPHRHDGAPRGVARIRGHDRRRRPHDQRPAQDERRGDPGPPQRDPPADIELRARDPDGSLRHPLGLAGPARAPRLARGGRLRSAPSARP